MNAIQRLFYEYGNLWRLLPLIESLRLFAVSLRHGLEVLRSRRLTAVDAAMSRNIRIQFHGVNLNLPLADIDRATQVIGDNPVFGNLREMFANDVYLRAFRPSLQADCVVDLGSNRGLFLVIALRVMRAKLAVGVEPEAGYADAWRLLCAANGLSLQAGQRITAAVVAENVPKIMDRSDFQPISHPSQISMIEVLNALGDSRVNFLKCDIEGMEYPLLADARGWLGRVDNLAMEVHPNFGDNRQIVEELRRAGFVCLVTDRFGRRMKDPKSAEFIYASSTGDLICDCSSIP